MRDVAAIGFCCIDRYAGLNLSYPTGNGIDCIVHLSRRGIGCSAISVVGRDPEGDEMLAALRAMGIDISHMQRQEGRTSVFEMELRENNDRVHIRNIPGVMEHYVPTAEDIAFASSHAYVHTDLFGRVLDYIPHLKENGARLILDFSVYADERNMARLLPEVDFAFFSVGEGNHKQAEALLKRAEALGGSVMTATLGEDGSLCSAGGRLYRCEAVRAFKVVNTVGAGDSFIAGFMEGIIRGWDIPACLHNGAELAAQIVAQFNPY